MSAIHELDHLILPLEDIKLATNNFSDDNFIAQGGFGKVYKGQLNRSSTDPGITVAVKRLDAKSGQGQPEFLQEIFMLSSYKHDNLVSLVGFCDDGHDKILVYVHEARGSLDNYLASDHLSWVQRLLICLGAARGLNYLHCGVAEGHRVIHRDVKSSNVLLDENWEAKISDFGLSKIGPTNQEFTFLVTNAAGTYGYVDPQYVNTDMLTKESDVYSFGVILFEVLCGRLAMIGRYDDERRFLSHLAKLRYEEGKLDEIILSNVRKQIKPDSLRTFSKIAYQCLKYDRKQRPTMAMIIEQLQTSLEFQIVSRRITRIGLWGSSTGGSEWSLRLDSNQKIRKVTIDHKDWIWSIWFTTEDFSGLMDSQHYGGSHGPSRSKISEVSFDRDEEIIGITGTVVVTTPGMTKRPGFVLISSLSFRTTKKTHGPFGKELGTPFSVSWDVGSLAGFHGRGGRYLDGFGCYLKPTI